MLRYSETFQGSPDDVPKSITFVREVLNVSEHFFEYGNVPYLTLVLSLGDLSHYENACSYRPRDLDTPNSEDGLMAEQKIYYRALKACRNETAKTEGRPVYAIARNTQLVELVKTMPKSLAAIKEVDGLGEGFCEKYGKKVLVLRGIESCCQKKVLSRWRIGRNTVVGTTTWIIARRPIGTTTLRTRTTIASASSTSCQNRQGSISVRRRFAQVETNKQGSGHPVAYVNFKTELFLRISQ